MRASSASERRRGREEASKGTSKPPAVRARSALTRRVKYPAGERGMRASSASERRRGREEASKGTSKPPAVRARSALTRRVKYPAGGARNALQLKANAYKNLPENSFGEVFISR